MLTVERRRAAKAVVRLQSTTRGRRILARSGLPDGGRYIVADGDDRMVDVRRRVYNGVDAEGAVVMFMDGDELRGVGFSLNPPITAESVQNDEGLEQLVSAGVTLRDFYGIIETRISPTAHTEVRALSFAA